MSSALLLVGYFTLFVSVAVALVFGGLLLGRILRPNNPTPMKRETYECGEPAVGSADIQFDIRFYVIALVFLIFDVEVALFFPWATVFGKATHLASTAISTEIRRERLMELGREQEVAVQAKVDKSLETDARISNFSPPEQCTAGKGVYSSDAVRNWGRQLAGLALCDILVFFGILMVGFAYLWHQGDLRWVRAAPQRSPATIAQVQEGQDNPGST
ncbi:MAG: NADH-quinone oxidoreductase subunit A [Thermogutta sp.]